MQQERLFRMAVDSVDVNAFYEWPRGWHLCVRVRRADESWSDVEPDLYDGLSSEELADVIACSIQDALGLT